MCLLHPWIDDRSWTTSGLRTSTSRFRRRSHLHDGLLRPSSTTLFQSNPSSNPNRLVHHRRPIVVPHARRSVFHPHSLVSIVPSGSGNRPLMRVRRYGVPELAEPVAVYCVAGWWVLRDVVLRVLVVVLCPSIRRGVP